MLSDSDYELLDEQYPIQQFNIMRRFSLETEDGTISEISSRLESDEPLHQLRNFYIEQPLENESTSSPSMQYDLGDLYFEVPLQYEFAAPIQYDQDEDSYSSTSTVTSPANSLNLQTVGWNTDEDDISEALLQRSPNLMMFEDSDYEDGNMVRNDVVLPQVDNENIEMDWLPMMDLDEGVVIIPISDDEYELLYQNLNHVERMIGEEILLGEPNWWDPAAMAA